MIHNPKLMNAILFLGIWKDKCIKKEIVHGPNPACSKLRPDLLGVAFKVLKWTAENHPNAPADYCQKRKRKKESLCRFILALPMIFCLTCNQNNSNPVTVCISAKPLNFSSRQQTLRKTACLSDSSWMCQDSTAEATGKLNASKQGHRMYLYTLHMKKHHRPPSSSHGFVPHIKLWSDECPTRKQWGRFGIGTAQPPSDCNREVVKDGHFWASVGWFVCFLAYIEPIREKSTDFKWPFE